MSWPLSTPVTTLNWTQTASSSSGIYLISCTNTALYLSSDYGQNFTEVTSGIPAVNGSSSYYTNVACSPDFTHLWLSVYSDNQSISPYLSTNSGVTWSSVDMSSVGGNLQYSNNPIAIDKTYNIYYPVRLGINVVYKSTNNGISWTTLGGYGGASEGISVSDNGSVIAVGQLTGVYSVSLSTNSGNSFTKYFSGEYGTNGVACSSDGSIVYAISTIPTGNPYTNKIYKTTNGGTTWSNIFQLSINQNYRGVIACSPNGTQVAFALKYIGVYTSTNSGNTFTLSGAGSPNVTNFNWTCASVNNSGYLTAAANGGNMYYYGSPVICFAENSVILCLVDGKETYVPVQDLRKGTLVKTSTSGVLPVKLIGSSQIYNPANELRYTNRLFRLPKSAYPELTDDLIVTGGHSILLPELTEEQKEAELEEHGELFVTEDKYRLMVAHDKRAVPHEEQGVFNIWHFSLENEQKGWNYGVYANGGLLVESASEIVMQKRSGMVLLE